MWERGEGVWSSSYLSTGVGVPLNLTARFQGFPSKIGLLEFSIAVELSTTHVVVDTTTK